MSIDKKRNGKLTTPNKWGFDQLCKIQYELEFKDVSISHKGLAEAKDISCYLNPLQRHFTQFDETDFAESKILLKPLIHVVCLVWSTSRYYCQSSKIIVLLRQVVNMLIYQVSFKEVMHHIYIICIVFRLYLGKEIP